MGLTANNPDAIKKKLLERIGFTTESAQKIADNISSAFSDKIKSGQLTPTLKAKTIEAKKLKGYSNPQAPLYATGVLADSLSLGEHNNKTIEIVSNSKVLPSWHTNHRAKGVPKRIALNESELREVIDGALNGN